MKLIAYLSLRVADSDTKGDLYEYMLGKIATAGQTVLERTQHQQSCVFDGLESPYAMRAIAAWERSFRIYEKTLADGRPWLMGDQFTLAEVDPAPFIARLDGSRTGPIPANGGRRSRPDRVIWKRASVRPIKSAVRWNGKVRKWLTTLDKSGPNT